MKNEILSSSGSLYEEPMALINEELREPTLYVATIRAIANGRNRINAITSATGKDSSALSSYMSNLQSLGIIEKAYPIETRNHKKTIYRLKDNLFRFYYRFIDRNNWLIENGQSNIVII